MDVSPGKYFLARSTDVDDIFAPQSVLAEKQPCRHYAGEDQNQKPNYSDEDPAQGQASVSSTSSALSFSSAHRKTLQLESGLYSDGRRAEHIESVYDDMSPYLLPPQRKGDRSDRDRIVQGERLQTERRPHVLLSDLAVSPTFLCRINVDAQDLSVSGGTNGNSSVNEGIVHVDVGRVPGECLQVLGIELALVQHRAISSHHVPVMVSISSRQADSRGARVALERPVLHAQLENDDETLRLMVLFCALNSSGVESFDFQLSVLVQGAQDQVGDPAGSNALKHQEAVLDVSGQVQPARWSMVVDGTCMDHPHDVLELYNAANVPFRTRCEVSNACDSPMLFAVELDDHSPCSAVQDRAGLDERESEPPGLRMTAALASDLDQSRNAQRDSMSDSDPAWMSSIWADEEDTGLRFILVQAHGQIVLDIEPELDVDRDLLKRSDGNVTLECLLKIGPVVFRSTGEITCDAEQQHSVRFTSRAPPLPPAALASSTLECHGHEESFADGWDLGDTLVLFSKFLMQVRIGENDTAVNKILVLPAHAHEVPFSIRNAAATGATVRARITTYSKEPDLELGVLIYPSVCELPSQAQVDMQIVRRVSGLISPEQLYLELEYRSAEMSRLYMYQVSLQQTDTDEHAPISSVNNRQRTTLPARLLLLHTSAIVFGGVDIDSASPAMDEDDHGGAANDKAARLLARLRRDKTLEDYNRAVVELEYLGTNASTYELRIADTSENVFLLLDPRDRKLKRAIQVHMNRRALYGIYVYFFPCHVICYRAELLVSEVAKGSRSKNKAGDNASSIPIFGYGGRADLRIRQRGRSALTLENVGARCAYAILLSSRRGTTTRPFSASLVRCALLRSGELCDMALDDHDAPSFVLAWGDELARRWRRLSLSIQEGHESTMSRVQTCSDAYCAEIPREKMLEPDAAELEDQLISDQLGRNELLLELLFHAPAMFEAQNRFVRVALPRHSRRGKHLARDAVVGGHATLRPLSRDNSEQSTRARVGFFSFHVERLRIPDTPLGYSHSVVHVLVNDDAYAPVQWRIERRVDSARQAGSQACIRVDRTSASIAAGKWSSVSFIFAPKDDRVGEYCEQFYLFKDRADDQLPDRMIEVHAKSIGPLALDDKTGHVADSARSGGGISFRQRKVIVNLNRMMTIEADGRTPQSVYEDEVGNVTLCNHLAHPVEAVIACLPPPLRLAKPHARFSLPSCSRVRVPLFHEREATMTGSQKTIERRGHILTAVTRDGEHCCSVAIAYST
ncbi:hypothetical protein FVE85_2842 [Porphyridium purpureum]|uniref:Uncharacterized protein n=1 Tax=Porphyridium purpureum TaxID=35688 RepID=A0A5J4YSX3_PORPP|nr:hypothetical protein FVE85_2842 [Porphyridium purpureum]|eukprot:POR5185..scf227_4